VSTGIGLAELFHNPVYESGLKEGDSIVGSVTVDANAEGILYSADVGYLPVVSKLCLKARILVRCQ
jgi:hypothetical protein